MIFPVISLWQPWASLIFVGDKLHETRSFAPPTKYVGGRIAIQAAQRVGRPSEMSEELAAICVERFGADWRQTIPRGVVVGTAHLVGVVPTADARPDHRDYVCGDWTPGRFAWQLELPEQLRTPLAMRGKQGWSTVDLGPVSVLP